MKFKVTTILLLVFSIGIIHAQETQEELAKAAANPLADLMSFPFQNNLNMNYGPHNRNVNVLNIQPVIPFFNGKFITRTIIPIISIPDFAQESGMQSTGLADIVLTGFYVPESKGLNGVSDQLLNCLQVVVSEVAKNGALAHRFYY